jgi:hypothetical protein
MSKQILLQKYIRQLQNRPEFSNRELKKLMYENGKRRTHKHRDGGLGYRKELIKY